MKFDLSELPIAPHQYRIGGIAFLVSGAIMFIIGMFLAFSTQSEKTDSANRLKASATQCVEYASQLGLKAAADGNKIRISDPNMSQMVQLLAASSQVVGLCTDWELAQYCLGSGCKPAGLTMILQYNQSKN
jgi:hypothetical protein